MADSGSSATRRGLLATLHGAQDGALLIARVLIGVVFFAHGWRKVGTTGMTATVESFEQMDVPLPTASAWFAALVELLGGLALILGLAVPLVGLLLAVDMLGAYVLVHAGNGIFVADGGAELVMALGATSLLLTVFGGGRYSLDHLIAPRLVPGRRRTTTPT